MYDRTVHNKGERGERPSLAVVCPLQVSVKRAYILHSNNFM